MCVRGSAKAKAFFNQSCETYLVLISEFEFDFEFELVRYVTVVVYP